jgi:pimeloyl-ACP methyl ester carboxylesterase
MRSILLLAFSAWLLSVHAQTDTTKRPILFVHGFLASGDTWAAQIQRFRTQGYPESWLHVFDWNTLGNRQESAALKARVQFILEQTQQKQVVLIGHSAGGGLCYSLLKDTNVAPLVKAYIHTGSMKIPGPVNTIPTLNLYSNGDRVTGGQDVPGATNKMLPDLDHLQIAASAPAFDAMYQFIHGVAPAAVQEPVAKRVRLAGRVVHLGDNKPVSQATVTVYAFNPQLGKRLRGNHLAAFTPDSLGYWQADQIPTGQALEFDVAVPGAVNLHYYFEPFRTDDAQVYLRCIPKQGMAARMLAGLPETDSFTLTAVFTQFQAVVAGRDSLQVQGQLLSTEELMAAKKTVIASFLYDDGDRQTSMRAIPGMGTGVFMQGVDMSIPTRRDPMHIRFNGRDYRIPCLPSSNDLQIVVFR